MTERTCDYCTAMNENTPAEFDGATSHGPWAYMCMLHFRMYGKGLGVGIGQELLAVDLTRPL